MDLMGALVGNPANAVVAGDVRANENMALTAVHTLFAREHNRIVSLLPRTLSEEDKFQIASRSVGVQEVGLGPSGWRCPSPLVGAAGVAASTGRGRSAATLLAGPRGRSWGQRPRCPASQRERRALARPSSAFLASAAGRGSRRPGTPSCGS